MPDQGPDTRSTRYRWFSAAAYAITAIVLLALRPTDPFNIVVAVIAIALAFGISPLANSLRAPETNHQVAQETGKTSDGVLIYHRPGCSYCLRLRLALGRRLQRRAAWIDIWANSEAAAFVRSVNDGNETVPTVVIDGQVHTNPPPSLVRQALRAQSSDT